MGCRLVLVKPPEISRFNFGAFSLGTLAAAVRDRAQVTILDATNLSLDDAVKAAASYQPDIVGITAMALSSVDPATAFLRQWKMDRDAAGSATGRALLLVGGHGASMSPAPLLSGGADAVVIGEGEGTLRRLLDHGIQPGMPGVCCRVGGRVILGPRPYAIRPLGRLPFPARDLMPPPPGGVHLMETSRGCPHTCAFCETSRFYSNLWRPHTPERVGEEVRQLVEEYRGWIVHFADDNFAASPRRVLRLCERLTKGPLPVCIFASARADDLLSLPDLIPAMAKARILRVTVGVETVDPETAARIGKPIPLDVYKEAFKRLRTHGIFSVASFITGLPGEGPTARERAVEKAVEVAPDAAHFLPFIPFPGIPLASGRKGFHPDPADIRHAGHMNRAFNRHPVVRARLHAAAGGDGIRGLMARAALERLPEPMA